MSDPFQIGDRVWIRTPHNGQLRQGTIYAICPERDWPYHVLPDGEHGGVAHTEAELAPASLPRDQVVPMSIGHDEINLIKSVMGLM